MRSAPLPPLVRQAAGLTSGMGTTVHDRLSRDRTQCALLRQCYGPRVLGWTCKTAPRPIRRRCVRAGIGLALLTEKRDAPQEALRRYKSTYWLIMQLLEGGPSDVRHDSAYGYSHRR